MQKLIIQNNAIIGTTTADDPNNYQLIDPPTDWDNDLVGLVFEADTQTVNYSVDALRAKQTAMVQADATTQINAMQWRIERAKERETLGIAGETVNQILLEKEAIRKASNRVENEINKASTITEIKNAVLAIKPEDMPIAARVSRLEFLRRFTDDEMNAFVTATKNNIALESYLMKLQNAEGIVLTDPATIMGVQALEMLGIIGTGRAAIILTV